MWTETYASQCGSLFARSIAFWCGVARIGTCVVSPTRSLAFGIFSASFERADGVAAAAPALRCCTSVL